MLTSAPSSSLLIDLVEEHGEAFNAVHCGAFWVRIGQLSRQDAAERGWVHGNPERMTAAREHTQRLLPTFAPRQLANTAHGAASCGLSWAPPWSTFWSRIASAAVARSNGMRSSPTSELKDLAWGFATAGARAPRLLEAISAVALERLDELEPVEMSILAWRCEIASDGFRRLSTASNGL